MTRHQFRGRREDFRLVSGRGFYTADHYLSGALAGHFFRADRAHARIMRINTDACRAAPGVVDVITAADLVEQGWKGMPATSFFKGVGGSTLKVPFRTGLAHERVRFVGEPVVLIIAETEYAAQDAAELISIDYEDLPPLVEAASALQPHAVAIHEALGDNLGFDYEYGSREAADAAFAEADHVVKTTVRAQRIAGNPMEPKSCVAKYEPADGTYDLFVPTQGTADIKATLSVVIGLPAEKFRVHSVDVGGGFGVRNELYPEFIAVLLAAKRSARPVRWIGTRSESISGDHHGRAVDLSGELALDRSGRFLALKVDWLVNLGAYCSLAGPLTNSIAAPTSSAISLYDVPAVYGHHRLVFTNTTPTCPYRGAGRPNVAYLWERLVEEAAVAVGIDSVELRRRNVLRKESFPFKTPTGSSYDSGDPLHLLDTALEAADWAGFKRRRKQSAKSKMLRGIGLALFLEPSGGMGKEQVEIRIEKSGRLAMYTNAGPSGQGHETVFPAIVAEILGLPEDLLDLRYNAINAPQLAGTGSFGSRSLISHGSALRAAAREIVEKGRRLAAEELETEVSDVTFADGLYQVAGTDLSITLETLLTKEYASGSHPLDANTTIDLATAFPSGAHVAEVELDIGTGAVQIVNYVAVDDCGQIYNHKLVEGQLHGGLMQGIGQVFGEKIAYDPDTGQLLSGSFMDYVMPRADHLAPIMLIDRGVPSPANPLGAKGAGEAGTTGSVPALANAVLDALRQVGVKSLDMPYSSDRIWNAIRASVPPEEH